MKKKIKPGSLKKKSNQELSEYNDFLVLPSLDNVPTNKNSSPMLKGTNDYDDREEEKISQKPVKKIPTKCAVWDWVRNNAPMEIALTIFIAMGGCLINMRINYAVLDNRVDDLSRRIENVERNYEQKENLELRMDNIKSEMETSLDVHVSNINAKLDKLEDDVNKAETR